MSARNQHGEGAHTNIVQAGTPVFIPKQPKKVNAAQSAQLLYMLNGGLQAFQIGDVTASFEDIPSILPKWEETMTLLM